MSSTIDPATVWQIDGAADHGVSDAVYLHDPDHNGIQLCRDRPRGEWQTAPDGSLVMVTEPLDVRGLLEDATT